MYMNTGDNLCYQVPLDQAPHMLTQQLRGLYEFIWNKCSDGIPIQEDAGEPTDFGTLM
jgi:hypothetical protein